MNHTNVGAKTNIDQSFSSLSLSPVLLKNLASLGYVSMTPIQAQSLPLMLKGEDVIAKAKTGSGKTAAFGLSLLNSLKVEQFTLQALVLCPTRELAEQVCQALRRLARLMPNVKILNLSGGMPMKPQLDSLRHGAHIIVGTPGRIQKHLDKQSLSLDKLRILVLDEADRMLDMGFLEAMQSIIALCPKRRQTLMFSATYPAEIKKCCHEFMHNPKEVHVDMKHTQQEIEQCFYEIENKANKFALLKALLLHYKPSSTLIFCNTKQLTAELATQLVKEGFSACALHGDMEQAERDLAVIRFKNQSCSILVATDVAARGLDIQELPAVINYELAFEHDVHIHRIGRTGRAGHKGLALSLTTPADAERLCVIQASLQHPLPWGESEDLGKRSTSIFLPDMVTLCINAGRKDKIRPGDIVGALTKEAGLAVDAIGKIDILDLHAYVAIQQSQADRAYQSLKSGKLKGRKIDVRKVR
jgi:ATP-dependent RNA helicase DbpA